MCESGKRCCECAGGKGGQVEIVQVAVYAVEQFVCVGNVRSVSLLLLRITVEQLNSKVRWVHSGYAWLHVVQRKESRPMRFFLCQIWALVQRVSLLLLRQVIVASSPVTLSQKWISLMGHLCTTC